MTTTLVQSIAERQSAAADKRVEALGLYRELLARRASPRDDDLAALSELQIRLGKSDDDIKAEIVLLDREARLNHDLDKMQVLTKESLAAQEELKAYRTTVEALEREQMAETGRLQHECNKVHSQLDHLRRAQPANELRLLRGENRELFGIEPLQPVEPPPTPVVPSHAETRIEEVRRRREAYERSPVIGPNQAAVVASPPVPYVKPKPRVH